MHGSYLLWIPCLVVVSVLAMGKSQADTAGIFVSTDGNDAWSGTLPAPNAGRTDGPLATLGRSRDAIRQLKASGARGELTVTVRAGTYYLAEPLVLTPEDSGTPDRPVRYQAYPGETVTLSGGRAITSEWEAGAGEVYTTQLPQVAAGDWHFRLLRVGDDWAIRARYPNYDPERPYTGGWLFVKQRGKAEGQFGSAVGSIHNRGDMMEWPVEIPATGDYNIFHYYAAQNAPWGKTDMGGSTAFTVDDGEPVVLQNLQDTGSFNAFEWSAKNATLHLEEGRHSIRWTNIEGGGINYDAFVLCDDPDWTPVGVPPAPPPAGMHLIVVHAETFARSRGSELTVDLPASKRYFGFDPDELKAWPRSREIEMHVFPAWGWVSSIEPVAELDLEGGVGTLAGPEANQELRVGNRYFLENILEELDVPGEWYLDRDDGVLHYWPTTASFAQEEIVAPVHDRIIHIRGDAAAGTVAGNIEIVGFTFKDTSYTPRIDSPYYPPDAAIWIEEASDCLIENCRFTRVGGSALNLVGDARRNRFLGNTVEYVGQNGVFMVGSDGDVRFPMDNVVAGNRIHHIGLIYKHVAGVYIGARDPSLAREPGNLIAHNLITDVPRYAIGIKMSQGNSVVEYNEIRRTNLETNDTGGIESCVRNENAAGNIYRFNLVADAVGLKTTPEGEILTPFYSWGIYLDDHSSHAHVYGNICVRNYRGGVHVHGGRENVVENNILVDSLQQNVEFNNIGAAMVRNKLIRNIICRADAGGDMVRSGGWTEDVIAEADHNLYWHAGEEPVVSFLGKSLEEWQRMGYDQHSLVADPLFVDAANDDFRLKPDSPALKLGFKPIDVSMIGLSGYDRSNY